MSNRPIHLYLADILESGNAIASYVRDIDFADFTKDRMRYSAVIREFEIIGEAVAKLPEEVKQKYTAVAWRDIKDFRNLLIHEYFGVDLEIVWNTANQELPVLVSTVRNLLDESR